MTATVMLDPVNQSCRPSACFSVLTVLSSALEYEEVAEVGVDFQSDALATDVRVDRDRQDVGVVGEHRQCRPPKRPQSSPE